MAAVRKIKVFIASPGDLHVERRAFKDSIDELNQNFGRGAKVEFEPLAWEDGLYAVGRRAQSVIDGEVDACDVFVLVLWRRWGQDAPDAAPYSSYTEGEFYRALDRFKSSDKPTIYVFLKDIDPGQMADPGKQLKKVLAFRLKLEKEHNAIGRPFSDEAGFVALLDRHLKGFAEGLPVADDVIDPSALASLQAELEAVKKERERYQSELVAARAKVEELTRQAAASPAAATQQALQASHSQVAKAEVTVDQLALAESAAKAALDGRIEEARQDFANALDGTTNLRILFLGYEFFRRIGELDEAERLAERRLAIAGRDPATPDTSRAIGNLGVIAETRGNLDAAEKLHREALEIDRNLEHLEGQARHLGNLGGIAQTRGDLDAAETLLREALDIDRKLGRLEGQARHLGNLGLIARRRGDLDAAEKLHRESLEISRELGRLEGQASQLGNLGLIARTHGDLDAAETLHRESLEIHRKLGRLEGQASDLGNLGAIAKQRKDFPKARRLWVESRDLFAKIGMPHMVTKTQGLLDALPPVE